MTPKGKSLLKISGAFAILLGIICVFVGFYIMACGMSLDEASTPEQMKMMRLLSAGGMYVCVNAVVNVIAGFIGFINAAELEHATKIRNYGYLLIGFAVINIVALFIFVKQWKILSLITLIVPTLIAILYFIGGYLNVQDEKKYNTEHITQ